MPAGILDEALALVRKRLAELDEERKRLERALTELGGEPVKKGPGRPKGSKAKAPKKRRGRKGGRADQAVEYVEKNPGCKAAAIAKHMKIKPNYLYRVLGELEKAGRVRKDGLLYFPINS